jgi:hypothetical protein
LPPENPELLKFFLKDHFPILREAKEGEESASMKIVVSERKRGNRNERI